MTFMRFVVEVEGCSITRMRKPMRTAANGVARRGGMKIMYPQAAHQPSNRGTQSQLHEHDADIVQDASLKRFMMISMRPRSEKLKATVQILPTFQRAVTHATECGLNAKQPVCYGQKTRFRANGACFPYVLPNRVLHPPIPGPKGVPNA